MSSPSETSAELTREDLRRFAEEKTEILNNNPQMNEEETKTAIITDFVNLLGWEIPQDGRMEYEFGEHNTNRVDYAFFHNGTSKLFVEAKPQGTALNDRHRNQITEYLVLDNTDLGILTNGEVYEFYRRFVNDDRDVDTPQIAEFPLSDFPDHAALISIFSKTQVENETYIEQLERINELRTAQTALEEQQDQIAGEVVEVVTESVGSIAEQPAQSHVVEFLDSIEEDLMEMAPTGRSDPENDPRDVVERETGVEFRGDEVQFTADVSARDHLRDVIQILFGHGHLTTDDLPVAAGPTRYILNTEPTDREDDEMVNGEEVVDGVYVELNANEETLKRYTKTIVEVADNTSDKQDSTIEVDDSVDTPTESSSLEMVDGIVIDEETGDPLFSVMGLEAISGADSADVGVYASDFDRGLPFIAEHNAWGFINIASEPDYFCIYLNRPYQQIQLIGTVDDIISKDEFIEGRELDRDPSEIADTKKAIEFSDIYQLETPITVGETTSRMQGLLYTTLGNLRTAETTDDL